MSAFLDEMESCVPALRRYARALTRDPVRGDDLVQDCLERALRKRPLWRSHGQLKSWLFKMMLNLHRNNLRDAARAMPAVALDDLPVPPASSPEQPARLMLADVEKALHRLSDEQRQALLLVALEGFGYAEAARILGIPVGTLMSRLGRARENLRRLTDEAATPTLRRVK